MDVGEILVKMVFTNTLGDILVKTRFSQSMLVKYVGDVLVTQIVIESVGRVHNRSQPLTAKHIFSIADSQPLTWYCTPNLQFEHTICTNSAPRITPKICT